MPRKTSADLRNDIRLYLKSLGEPVRRKELISHFIEHGYSPGQLSGVLHKADSQDLNINSIKIPNVARFEKEGSVFYYYSEDNSEDTTFSIPKISWFEQLANEFDHFEATLIKKGYFTPDIRYLDTQQIGQAKKFFEKFDELKKTLHTQFKEVEE